MFQRQALTLIGALTLTCGALSASTIERKFDAQPGGLLEVDLQTGGSVEVIGWDRNEVAVTIALGGRNDDRTEVVVEPTSKGVRIESELSGMWRHSGSLDVTARVPRRYDVEIETMGGGLKLSGLEGRLSGRTMGGELKLSNLIGKLDLTTMGGEIELRDSDVDGEVKTMGGEVLFEDVRGDVKGSSMGGDVIYRNVTRRDGSGTGDKVVISTMGGDIRVDEAPAGADVHTMGGAIVVRSAREFVKAKTMGGDIQIEVAEGWVEATTMGGDIEVTVIDGIPGDRGVDIVSHGGEIRLVVPAGLGMNIDIELAYTRNSARDFKIESDFELERSESADWERHWGTARKMITGRGTVNGGGHRIKIRTINGSVRLVSGG